MPIEPRNRSLQVRLTEDELEEVCQAATAARKRWSEYARDVILEACRAGGDPVGSQPVADGVSPRFD